MNKTGIVISIINRKAGIMTSSGEFVYIKISKPSPKIGEIYTGELCSKHLSLYKYAITAASLMLMFISSAYAYAYYTPITTVVLSIKPSISIKANRWNKIISSKALDSDGALILDKIKLKNKSIDDGLELLIEEAKTENFINDKYVNDKNIINVDIKSNRDNTIDISNFKNIIDANNLSIIINASSSNNKKIDITVNNKKFDASTVNSNNHKSQVTDETSNIKKNPLKNPSMDNKIIQDKSSTTKKGFKNNEIPIKNKDSKINNNDKSDYKIPKNNSYNIPSSNKNFVPSNEITKHSDFDIYKNAETVKIPNDNRNVQKHSLEIQEKDSTNKHSDSYKPLEKVDNTLHRFVRDLNDWFSRKIVHIFYIFFSINNLSFVKDNSISKKGGF